MSSSTQLSEAPLAAAFAAILPADRVIADRTVRELMSQDIWARGDSTAELVIAPRSTLEVSRALALASRLGKSVAVRGGGLSYTSGYVPTQDGTILFDLHCMDALIDLDPQDMTVTVEAGCTWKTLRDALSAHGLRTPFWGPLSGVASTIGGGVAQLNAFFGAGQHGTTSESVVGLTIVLADGQLIRTGARRGGAHPFYRHYGPDLTGLFCGDCGAFGIKTEVTLRLIPDPPHAAHASFVFPGAHSLLRAATAITRANVASELLAFDPNLAAIQRKRASLGAGLAAVKAVTGAEKSLLTGVRKALKVAIGGREALSAQGYPLHVTVEGRSAGGVQSDLAQARKLALDSDGVEIEPALPTVLRAHPFPPPNSVLGPEGERWVPVHGIVALSDAWPCVQRLQQLFQSRALSTEGIVTGLLMTSLSTNGFLIEPVFYWRAARSALHENTLEAGLRSRLPRWPDDPEATALVAETRRAVIAVFKDYGAAHFQIGRTYPWLDSLDPAARVLMDAVKSAVDPARRLNTGNLGL